MQIKFLGGVQEVGKSATLVDTDIKLLLDYGMKIRRSEEDSRFPASFGEYVDLVAVGHCHIDHSGFLPSVFDKCSPRVIGTPYKGIDSVAFRRFYEINGRNSVQSYKL